MIEKLHSALVASAATLVLAPAAGVVALAATLVLAPAAVAETPIQIENGANAGGASVAVDSSGTGYVAWPNLTTGVVDYCVLPAGATACSASGTLTPSNGQTAWRNAKVLIDAGTVSILAEVGHPGGYYGIVEWQAPDGSASFSPVDGGQSVAMAEASSSALPLLVNGVVLPGAGVLGLGWEAASSEPTFQVLPLSSPSTCSSTVPQCPFAWLQPPNSSQPVSNEGGDIGSSTGSNPGVLGVYGTHATGTGPFTCPKAYEDGAAFAYGSGTESPSNDYNVSPGSPNSAWRVAATPIPNGCVTDQWAVGGGPSGLGVLQNNNATAYIEYLPFDQATMSFDKPAVPIAQAAEDESSMSQDAAGNIYATFNLDGPDGPVALAYSSDGGATWKGPAPLEPNPQFGDTAMQSAVGPGGNGWATYLDGGALYAIEFDSADTAATVSATLGGGAVSTPVSVVVELKCFSVPCTVTTTLLGRLSGKSADAARARTTTLGQSGTLRITKHGVYKLAIPLTKAGRKLLRSGHGKVAATMQEATTVGAYTQKNTLPIKIKIKVTAQHKHKHKQKHKHHGR